MAIFLLIGLIKCEASRVRPRGLRVIDDFASSASSSFSFALSVFSLQHHRLLQMASAMHLKETGHGFDDPIRYLFRSTGGIIAYLISTSFAIAILPIAAARRSSDQPPLARVLCLRNVCWDSSGRIFRHELPGNRANLGDVHSRPGRRRRRRIGKARAGEKENGSTLE